MTFLRHPWQDEDYFANPNEGRFDKIKLCCWLVVVRTAFANHTEEIVELWPDAAAMVKERLTYVNQMCWLRSTKSLTSQQLRGIEYDGVKH